MLDDLANIEEWCYEDMWLENIEDIPSFDIGVAPDTIYTGLATQLGTDLTALSTKITNDANTYYKPC